MQLFVLFIVFFKRPTKKASDLKTRNLQSEYIIQSEYINLNSIIDAAEDKNKSTNNNNKNVNQIIIKKL